MTAVATPLSKPQTRSSTVLLPLAAIVVVSTVVHALVAVTTEAPWIIPDEIIYAELAKSIAAGETPAIRGVASLGHGFVYPLLLAPAWALFGGVPDAYAAARLLNALLMSLTALPVFFLAARFVSRGLALTVAAASVAVPSMVYAGVLMTENAFYPAFALAMLAFARALERPTPLRQLAALGAVGLAFGTRAQAIALLPAYLGAALVHWWLERRAAHGRTRPFLAVHGVAVAAVGLGAVAFVGVQLARGGSPVAFLGAYRTVATTIDFAAIPAWFALHLADLALYVAVVPAAATIVMVAAGCSRRADARLRLYAALVPSVVVCMVLLVAAFASEVDSERAPAFPSSSAHVFERSIFPLVPLLLLGLALWFDRGMPRPRLAVVAALACGLAPAAIPFGRISDNLNFQAPALVPWKILSESAATRMVVLLIVGLALALLFLRVSRRRGVVWIVVLTSFTFSYLLAAGSIQNSSAWTREASVGAERDWIDDAVGRGNEVAVVWYEPDDAEFAASRRSQRIVWVNEFFNRAVGPVYAVGARLPYGLPDTRARVRGDSTLVHSEDGTPLSASYVLARCAGQFAGMVVARDEQTGVVVLRTQGVVQILRSRIACP